MKDSVLGQSLEFQLDAWSRIGLVNDILGYLEEFLPYAREQTFLRKRQQLQSSNGLMKEVLKGQLNNIESEWNTSIPAYFYGSLVVLLWSQIETVIDCFAENVKSLKNISPRLQDAKTTYSQLREYTQTVLNISLPDDNAMDDLQFLRNLYAHHGGDTSSLSKAKTKQVDAIIRTQMGVFRSDTFVRVDATYLRSALDTASTLIDHLAKALPSAGPAERS